MLQTDDSDVVNDHRVRLLHIAEEEEAVIRVRTKFHISLIFSNCTIEMFEKEGVVYTRQEYSKPIEDDTLSYGEADVAPDVDTEVEDLCGSDSDSDSDSEEEKEPRGVVDMAGGTFKRVNEKHAARLEFSGHLYGFEDIYREIEAEYKALTSPEYLRPGGTQLQDDYEAQFENKE
jgi:hypothetical protein